MAFIAVNAQIGVIDLYDVGTVAPGVINVASPTTTGSGAWPQLGSTIDGYDPVLGGGEFVYLSVPTATAIAAGLIVKWDGNYSVSTLAAADGGLGCPVAVTLSAIASQTPVQYAWFQVGGKATVLKTAVVVNAGVAIYVSATAGRVYVTASGAKQIVGARSANTASVLAATSTVAVMLSRPHISGAVT